jgi:hypothetical protein
MPVQLIGRVYDFGGECPKCKTTDPMRVFCKTKDCKLAATDAGEHLDCMCLSCGYSWPARCADHKPLGRKTTRRRKQPPQGGQPK